MKKLLLILCIAMSGCNNEEGLKIKNELPFQLRSIKVIEIDSCEYLFGDWGSSTVLTHKGNCNNHGK